MEIYTNTIGMEFVLIPAGQFLMGSCDGRKDERPRHPVSITRPFFLGKHPVTQAQWKAVMGKFDNPSFWPGDDLAVEMVFFAQCLDFIKKLNEREGRRSDRNCYRLPSEAEWEYAAGGGSGSRYFWGRTKEEFWDTLWTFETAGCEPPATGGKSANAFGVEDLGLVYEWTGSLYGPYKKGWENDPLGPESGELHVLRGSCWYDNKEGSPPRTAARKPLRPDDLEPYNGLRLLLEVEETPEARAPEPEAIVVHSAPSGGHGAGFDVVNSIIGMELVRIPGGEFYMGSPKGDGEADEHPRFRVRLSAFRLGKYPVTVGEWRQVMGGSPIEGADDRLPVAGVSWDEAQTFIRRLNEAEGHQRYRLPTEAEWEWASRASDDQDAPLSDAAWHAENSGGTAHPVGLKQPNAWGLYDMLGNVWEWAQDFYGPYPARPPDAGPLFRGAGKKYHDNPRGPEWGAARVLRGGSYAEHADCCRPRYRWFGAPDLKFPGIGFRLACSDDDAAAPKPAQKRSKAAYTNGIGMEFAAVPAGSFLMGSLDDPDRDLQELPQHRECVEREFLLGSTPVTRAQYAAVMGGEVNKEEADLPVDKVSWKKAVDFCDRLTEREQSALHGARYRLPTEAEWEYACRAGSAAPWCCGADERDLHDYAWFQKNSGGRIHRVGRKRPNAWGLYDMHGNVYEWVADLFRPYSLKLKPGTPETPEKPRRRGAEPYRVLRGGACTSRAAACRSAARLSNLESENKEAAGFRVVLELPEEETRRNEVKL